MRRMTPRKDVAVWSLMPRSRPMTPLGEEVVGVGSRGVVAAACRDAIDITPHQHPTWSRGVKCRASVEWSLANAAVDRRLPGPGPSGRYGPLRCAGDVGLL